MTYIIGEIGQNHNGSVDLAKLIIELISREIKDDVFIKGYQKMNETKVKSASELDWRWFVKEVKIR